MSDKSEKTTAGLDLAHELFQAAPLQIPNAAGLPYKTELVLIRSLEETVKVNFWHLPDDQRDPHSHPWDFESEILSGGYTEIRYWLDENRKVQHDKFTYGAGERNVIKYDVFHLVTEVQDHTVTKMKCGRNENEWGYLDVHTGGFKVAEPDPTFLEKLNKLNLWRSFGNS